MKKLKLMALLLAVGFTVSMGTSANAEVGYINYQKDLENLSLAQQAFKEILN